MRKRRAMPPAGSVHGGDIAERQQDAGHQAAQHRVCAGRARVGQGHPGALPPPPPPPPGASWTVRRTIHRPTINYQS